MPNILLTNDDGYQAIGFYPLLKELSKDFKVVAVAPLNKMSWKGKSITYNQDIAVKKKQLEEFEVYAVDGTPADCVQIGLYDFCETRPDFVVSGINIGMNAGHGRVLSSGTMGAGMEAAIDGIKAIASSLHITHDKDDEIDYFSRDFYHIYHQPAKITAKIIKILINQHLEEDVDLMSINMPFEATEQTPVEITSIARDKYGQLFKGENNIFKHTHPPIKLSGHKKGTDLNAINNGNISLTPISLDLTSERSKKRLEELIQESW
jgi:5'-nucleotidase